MAIVILAAAAVLAAYLEPDAPPIAGMARASDGDSFRLGEQRVRLLGIDAPELRQTCQDEKKQSWSCGQAARQHLAALLKRGPADCRPEGSDQYGRVLAYCTVAGQDLGAAMVREGLAVSSGDYWREEQAARSAGSGIWRGGFDMPRAWREDHTGQQSLWGWLPRFAF